MILLADPDLTIRDGLPAVERIWPETRCAFGQPTASSKVFGWLGPDHCWWCATETLRGCAAFAAGVAAGRWDPQGYTPAERKALEKRRRKPC